MKNQLIAAREGKITKVMERVARDEGIDKEELRRLIAEGKAAILANNKHKNFIPKGVGKGMSVKVTELMSEIAVASEEQSQGIDQINKAVAEMNQVTQQNAASAEKLSAIMAGFRTESRAEAEV